MWFAYMLLCSDDDIYKGAAKDVTARVKDHHNGRVDGTKDKLPVELIGYVAFGQKEKAFKFEKYLKTGSGRRFIERHFL